jgi:hypothetical protein
MNLQHNRKFPIKTAGNMSTRAVDVETISWDEFLRLFKWKQGEHVTVIGPTGSGKTWLVEAILPLRKYVAILITKKKDPMIQKFQRGGYERVKSWVEIPHEIHSRILLHPPFARDEPKERYQQVEFAHAFDRAFEQGHWTLYADELPYIIDDLGLERKVKRQLNQGRSLKSSLVSSAQRPAFLPLLTYSAATHVFFFRTTDEADLKRIGGLGGISNKLIREVVAVLESHQALYLNTRTGQMYITKVS